MKKFGKYIISICFAIMLVIGASMQAKDTTYALDEINPNVSTVYPQNISHYLDLNNVNDFCVTKDEIYFSTRANSTLPPLYTLTKYNPKTNTKTVIYNEKDNLLSVNSVQSAYGMVLVIYEYPSYRLIDQVTGESITLLQGTNEATKPTQNYTIADYEDSLITAKVYEKDSKMYLGVAKYNSRENYINDDYAYFDEFDLSSISANLDSTSKITIVGKDIYIANNTNIYHFYINDENNTFKTTLSGTKTIAILANLKDMQAFSFGDETFVALTTNTDISVFDKELSAQTSTTHFDKAYNENCIYIYDKKLYFYNAIESNIKTYTISKAENISLTFDQTLLMGKGSDLGRFDGVNSIEMKCNEYMFVSDRGNHRIQVIMPDKKVKAIDLIDGSTLYYAKALMLSSNNTLYYIKTDSIDSKLCGYNLFTGKTITPISISNSICDATMADNGKIYLLNTESNSIEIIDTKNNFAKSSITDLTFTSNAFSKIAYMDNAVVVSVDNILYKVNVKNPAFHYDSITLSNDIDDISIPSTDPSIYVSIKDQNTIERVCFDNGVLTGKATKTVFDSEYDISTICVNPQDGKVYGYDENSSRIVYFSDTTFATGYNTIEPFQENVLTNMFGYSGIVKFGKLKANNFIFEYINYKGNHNIYPEDKYVIALDTQKLEESFTYVMYVDGDKTLLGYVETSAIEISEITGSTPYSLITTNNNVPIYKFPTIKGNLKIDEIQNISTAVNALGVYPVSIDGVDCTYYIVKLSDNTYGYLPSTYVTANINITQRFTSNATVKIYDYSDFVNVYSDTDKSVIIGALSNDQRIYVETLDKNKEFTLIKYLDADNNIRIGYIDTKYISMDGSSPVIITAIILFCVNLVIITALLIWFFVFKKKQKKDELLSQSAKDDITENQSKTKSTKKKSNVESPAQDDNNDDTENKDKTANDNDNKADDKQ